MKLLLAVIICIVLLTGCTVPTATPVENTVTQGDFILTIESSQSQYSLKKIFLTKPLDIIATFTYTGKDDLKIWNSAAIGMIYLRCGDHHISQVMPAILATQTLKPNESILITQFYSDPFFHEQFIVGEYEAVVYADFYLDEELTERVYMEAEVPITIKK